MCKSKGFRIHIDRLMDSMLAQSLRDHGFEPWWGQIKEYKIVICCSTTKFRNKNKDWLA